MSDLVCFAQVIKRVVEIGSRIAATVRQRQEALPMTAVQVAQKGNDIGRDACLIHNSRQPADDTNSCSSRPLQNLHNVSPIRFRHKAGLGYLWNGQLSDEPLVSACPRLTVSLLIALRGKRIDGESALYTSMPKSHLANR